MSAGLLRRAVRVAVVVQTLIGIAAGDQDRQASAGRAGSHPAVGARLNATLGPVQYQYRARRSSAGDVVEYSTDGGALWSTLLVPVPALSGQSNAGAAVSTIGCTPSSYSSVRILAATGTSGNSPLYIGTAGAAGDYLDQGCSSAVGGIFMSAGGSAPPVRLGADGLPFAQDPAGRTIRAYDVDAVVPALAAGVIYVHASDGTGPASPPAGLYKTIDDGLHWSEIDTGLMPSSIITNTAGMAVPMYDSGRLTVDPENPNQLSFVNDTGSYQSNDGGATWRVPGASAPLVPTATETPQASPTAASASALPGSAGQTAGALPAGWSWQQLVAAGPPASRQDAAMAWDPAGHLLFVFGGTNPDTPQVFSDLWSYSPASNIWTQYPIAGPAARSGAGMVWDPNDSELIVFGGQNGTTYMNDVWAFRPSSGSWVQLSAPGALGAPSARSHAVVAWESGTYSRLLVFAGQTTPGFVNDLWAFAPGASTGVWTQISPDDSTCTTTCPMRRSSALGTWDDVVQRLVVFGGRDTANSVVSDSWVWTPNGPSAGTWANTNLGPQPAGRAETQMAMDDTHGIVVIGPGIGMVNPAGSSATDNVNDVWEGVGDLTGWQPLPVAASPQPLQRRLTTWAWDGTDGAFFMFGGRAINGVAASNDLWRLAPSGPVATYTPTPSAQVTPGLDEGWAVDNNGNVIQTDQQIALTGSAGARFVRVNFRLGNASDWTNATYLAAYDTVVNNYAKAGIQVLGLINQEATKDSNQVDWTAGNVENGQGTGSNPFIQTTYVQGAVVPLLAHFGDRVKYWELWNEPNSYSSCNGTVCTGGTFIYPSNFAALLVDSYTAVKDASGLGRSDVTLISGGLFGHSIGGTFSLDNAGATYLSNTFKTGVTNGTWSAFAAAHSGRYPLDGIGQHLYVDQNLITTASDLTTYYAAVKDAVAAYETPPQTYLTEGAWPAPGLTQDVQAENLDILFGATRSTGFVPRLTWFELQDVPSSGLYFGLAQSAPTPKVSYFHYQVQALSGQATATTTPTMTATRTGTPTASSTPTVTRTPTQTPIPTPTIVTLQIDAGWNAIALPLRPTVPLWADALLSSLLQRSGGSYAEVAGFTGGQWSQFEYRDTTIQGNVGGTGDFQLQLGVGYAVYSDKVGSVEVDGVPSGMVNFSVSPGWNLVGFPDATVQASDAYGLLDTLLLLSGGRYAEISGYRGGRWVPFAYDDHSTGGLGKGPRDFTLRAGQGYALLMDAAATATL